MDEKTMVNDILNGVKSELTTYQTVISETENMSLRQTIQQIRNNDESFQYELFKIATTKSNFLRRKSSSNEKNSRVWKKEDAQFKTFVT